MGIMSWIRGKTVLVTGAAGFVGNRLVDALAEQNTVIALDHFRTNSREQVSDAATIIDGDIRDPETLRRAAADVDLIFHQAAARGVADSIEQPLETHEVNVDATLTLLEVARDVDARVVLASSAAIYGEPSELPIPETAPKQPPSPYGVQKLTADHYARLWNERYDLETVVLRYFNVYGRRASGSTFRGVVGTFIEQARDGELTIVGDGSQTRDLVHVSDVVQANLRAATTDHVGRAYNIGSGTRIRISELAALIRERVNPDADVTYTDPQSWDVQDSHADISRAQAFLNYEPTVDLESCLRERERTAGLA